MTEPAGDRVDTGPIADLINAYADLRSQREAYEEKAKAIRVQEEKIEVELFDAMERQSFKSVRHARGTFSLNDLAWPKIDDVEAAREWATVASPDLLMVSTQRLQTVVREYVRGERDELPPGIGYRINRKINWRRGAL